MNYWLVRADWKTHNGGNQIERFVNSKIWENGYSDKFINSVNKINIGDILCLANKSDVLCYAKCIHNECNGKSIKVDNWLYFDVPIKFAGKGAYAKTIAKIANKELIKLIKFKIANGLVEKEKYIEKNSIYLDEIIIKNYFSLKDIEITNLKDKKEIYFVGGNGEGKTILLQAIVLALKKEYSGDVIEHIRTRQKMNLAVKDEYLSDYNRNVNIENVFAYGINRNKIDSKLFDTYGYSGLFDTSDPRKTTYLKDPFSELGREYQGDNDLIKEFIEKLNSIILKENYQLFNGGDIDFNELSEGYKSTVIWLYDLVSRLIENQKNSEKKVKKLADFKAIVLIDEVDLYLHPRWKYDFVYNLRKIFKNIQFIMITHSTATVLGATDDAVFYKVYKENGHTKLSQPIDTIKNLMANNLSTSPLFDMTTARARNSDENFDTSDDFIYTKIHQAIAQRVKGKKSIVEEDIENMINEELDNILKENDL